jgi:hypothetical protein
MPKVEGEEENPEQWARMFKVIASTQDNTQKNPFSTSPETSFMWSEPEAAEGGSW